MSNTPIYHSEINVPVKKDSRTFEQSRKDLVTKLEKSYKSSSTTDSGGDTVSSVASDTRRVGSGPLTRGSSWEFQRSRWIDEAKRQFDEDVHRMRSDMFDLKPIDEFDLENWDNFGSLTAGPGGSDHGFEAMERRMEAMRQQMDSKMRLVGSGVGAGPGHPGGHHQMTSHYSSSSTRTVNDGGVVSSNSATAQESRQTVDGVTTGTKSHSASSNTSKLGASSGRQIATSDVPPVGAVIPASPIGIGQRDFHPNVYEVGDDGQVHFKICFDAKDFAPEDIDVTTAGNQLTVHASKSIKTPDSTSSREFSRSVDLPRSIDHEKFQCSLTEDGVLVLDAPVKAPDYDCIAFDSGHNLGIRPKDSNALKTQITNTGLKITGQSGPVILNDGVGGRKIHLEVPVEDGYSAEDLCVRMDANKICVSGKKEKSSDILTSGSSSKSSAFSEFTRTFEVPETIDPFTVSAVLKNDILIIEAPLFCTV